ncbi:MAG: AraC family transcriptional regulator [Prochloraceae cyanobacterium]|nr:AraC family transcriptional regulator [Prochloraceae cyanobacterium]
MPAEKPIKVDLSREETFSEVFSKPPQLTSKQTGWNGIHLIYDRIPPGESPEVISGHHGIIIFNEVPKPIEAERRLDGCLKRDRVLQGDVVVIPANTPHQVRWDGIGGLIILEIEPHIFDLAISEALDRDRVEITPHFSTPDPLICQLGLKLKTELENGGLGSRLYADGIANLLSVHLLQNYSSQKPELKNYTGGLPKYKLKKAIEYINANLDRSLSLSELASLVQMSPSYFSRLFKQSTGYAPHQYVIRSRIKRAEELLKKQIAIVDVAYQVGFANQAHLNYHFKRLRGITPHKYKNL